MKKILIALSALALIASTTVGCKGKENKPEPKPVTVEVLKATPTSISKFVNESFVVSFDATAPGDVNVEVKPMDAKYALSVSDEAILKVEGLKVTCLAAGNANLIIKAGDKEAKVAVQVKEVAAVDEKHLIGAVNEGIDHRIYMISDFSKMKEQIPVIKKAMESIGWMYNSSGEEYGHADFYCPNDGKTYTEQRMFSVILYVHTATDGIPFICARTFGYQGMDGENFDKIAPSLMEVYGFKGAQKKKGKDGNAFYIAKYKDQATFPGLKAVVFVDPNEKSWMKKGDKVYKPLKFEMIAQSAKTRSSEIILHPDFVMPSL